MNPTPLLRERQVAELLSVTERTLQSWRQRRLGPAYTKIAGAVRYRVADVESFIQENIRGGESPARVEGR